jgi:hypothetical protein
MNFGQAQGRNSASIDGAKMLSKTPFQPDFGTDICRDVALCRSECDYVGRLSARNV